MRTLPLLLLLFCSLGGNAQKVIAKEIKQADLNTLIGNMHDFKTYKLDHVAVKLAICSNEFGSAAMEGTGEVSDRIYISQCSYGESLDCKLYCVESLLNVSIEKVIEEKNNVSIILNYGKYGEKKSATISVPLYKN